MDHSLDRYKAEKGLCILSKLLMYLNSVNNEKAAGAIPKKMGKNEVLTLTSILSSYCLFVGSVFFFVW